MSPWIVQLPHASEHSHYLGTCMIVGKGGGSNQRHNNVRIRYIFAVFQFI